MKLIVDKQTQEVTESQEELLPAVIQRISQEMKQQNRVISEIYLDGKPMSGVDDPNLVSMTVANCNELKLVSEEPRVLANKVLYEIASYMPKIQSALVETSARIQSRKEEDGLALLEQVTSTWAELFYGFQSALTVTGIDLAQINVKGQTFSELNADVHAKLDQISELVQEQQFLELSDILEYELAPKLPLLEEGIYQIIKEVERKPN